MGNFFSKTLVSEENSKEVEVKPPTTPILGTKIRNLDELDPRSPSTNVIRTPLQVILSSLDKTPKGPTEAKLPEKLHNKNLDNVRKTLITSPNDGAYPKLLKSCLITPKPENKRQSYIGLLETNLDCPETDLDEVIENKLGYTKITDPRSPSFEFMRTPIKVFIDVEGAVEDIKEGTEKSDDGLIEKFCESSNDAKESHDVEIKEEGTVELKDEEKVELEEDGRVEIKEEEKIELEKDIKKEGKVKIIMASTPEANILSKAKKSQSDVTPLPDKLNEVQSENILTPINRKVRNEVKINSARKIVEFNKKLNKIMKEEENEIAFVQPRAIGHRTPLGECNGQKKGIPKLKVSDKPRRLDYAVSKIPLYKQKTDIENVPPKIKGNGKGPVKWDNENTLII